MKKLLKHMTLYDKILIIAVISISLIFIVLPIIKSFDSVSEDKNKGTIVIQSNSEIVRKIPISETYRDKSVIVKIKGPIGISTIEADKGRVRIMEAPADDPLKVCEKTGWIDGPGPSIICVPNKISIWIESTEAELDGVTW